MYKHFIKRALDVLLVLIFLPFLLVLFLFVGIAIKIDDGGPVFYSSYRIGKNGKLFKMLKFRSMKVNSPDIRLADGSTYNGEDDPRVTRVGKFIRKTSIDELPQILNVFIGHMSFIGPRPDPEDWLERYTEEEKVFLTVRPGITGYSQAYYRNDADGQQKIKNDVYYATHCTFFMDLKIFFKTISIVFKRENTYKDTAGEELACAEAEALKALEKNAPSCEYGSEFDYDANLPYISKKERKYFSPNGLIKFRSGRDALKAVAKSYREKTTSVLLPALCCESMVLPFTMNGYKPIFYKINADYTGNEKDVESKLEDGCLFLYMPYFGIKPFKEKTLKKWKKERHIVLIEDTTQNALHKQKRSCADITVSSIRKWLSLPDGGLLWGDVQHIVEQETAFSGMRKQAMQLKSEYLKNGEDDLKQRYRKILDEAAISLDGQAEPFAMTEESARLLSTIKLDQILKKRKGNVRALKRGLKSLEKQGKIRYLTKTPTKSTLYFPIIVERRDELQKTLAENRIYCPVIWPLPEGAQGVCAISEYTAEYMLALPCDQRYGKKDMKYISKTLKKILGE